MPEPWRLQRAEAGGQVLVFRGPHLFAQYDNDDLGMRNLVIVGLTNAGCAGVEVAACFGLTPEYVSMLRGRARDRGSEGLVRPRGRRRSLSPATLARAAAWSRQGMTNVVIARRLGVHPGTIGRRLAAMGNREVVEQQPLADDTVFGSDAATDDEHEPGVEHDTVEDTQPACGHTVGDTQPASEEDTVEDTQPASGHTVEGEDTGLVPLARLGEVEVSCRYAGAMLLHAFLTRLGAEEILSSLPRGPARRYDAASLVLASTFAFVLGASSLEGSKHLVVADAGALLGTEAFPHLRTLRPRLRALAEVSDPIVIQSGFAKAMLGADDRPPEVFYIDDHFVTYWGKAPVAKGYNIRRHLAEPGRDDTFVVDGSWRAVCFASGEPRGLSVSLPEVLGQLKDIVGDRPVMVGFDRGGSYPKVFTALAAAGMEWITWRRAPLVAPTVAPRRSWVALDGRRRSYLLADETLDLAGYDPGPVRQLSAYEHGRVAFQILTSNMTLKGAPLVQRLRGRWCIENTNKYLEDHQGIHWLCTYDMDLEANTAKVPNPARRAARAKVTEATAAVAEAERSLGRQTSTRASDIDEHLATIRGLRDDVAIANDDLDEARHGLKGVPAKLPANQLNPDATRAKPRLAARALQMVCRLLAYNAELDLARHLNTYLADNDEYRAITRNLLHLGGRITFQRRQITVTLDRPNSPRVTRALSQLLDELSAGPPAHLTGDQRPIIYQMAP
jgi:DNA-binding CsgD family transcriptional regulator